MDTVVLALGLGLGAGLAPGPLLALVVAATLEGGFAAGARIALAPLLSDLPVVVLCVLVLQGLPDEVLAGLSLAGAAFVAWMAWDALQPAAADAAPRHGDVRRAVAVNLLSPHPWLFWITVGGPLLVDAGHDSPGLAVAFVTAFYALLVGTKIALAGAVAGARGRLGAGAGRVRVVSAVLLGAAAVALALDGFSRLGL